jgi:hypothetical protein
LEVAVAVVKSSDISLSQFAKGDDQEVSFSSMYIIASDTNRMPLMDIRK